MNRRVGITQRVATIAGYEERRDCLDQRWFMLIESIGMVPVPIPNSLNNVEHWCRVMNIEGLILSGGNDLAHLPGATNTAPERDATERALLDFAWRETLPVIGVCRGMQSLNHYLGGGLKGVTGHAGTRHRVENTATAIVLSEYGEQTVNSFHDWGIPIDALGKGLIAELIDSDGNVEGFRHDSLPWVGAMWHPERETPFKEQDIRLLNQLFRS